MRLWTLHARYLDAKGLVAAWREALLAQKVLAGGTKGYRHHPQLARLRAQHDPLAAIATFLAGLATKRGVAATALTRRRSRRAEPAGESSRRTGNCFTSGNICGPSCVCARRNSRASCAPLPRRTRIHSFALFLAK